MRCLLFFSRVSGGKIGDNGPGGKFRKLGAKPFRAGAGADRFSARRETVEIRLERFNRRAAEGRPGSDSVTMTGTVRAKAAALSETREAARGCRNCPLWAGATQTVFGEGRVSARLVLVGEQPGDQEDRAGKPFVGPAGAILDKALADAGIERSDCYVTNAVKHFKGEPRGKRRLHKKPSQREIAACHPWLEAELRIVQPEAVICMGATAAAALLGPKVRVTRDRGQPFQIALAKKVFVTVHPSLLLRMPDREAAKEEYERFVADLRQAAGHP